MLALVQMANVRHIHKRVKKDKPLISLPCPTSSMKRKIIIWYRIVVSQAEDGLSTKPSPRDLLFLISKRK